MDGSHEEESRFSKIFMTFGNIFALNVLWIVFSLPVITMGASTTALYAMTLKMVKNEEDEIFKGFWKAFKSNFKKATLSWLIVIAACVVIWGEFLFASVYDTAIGKFYYVLAFAESGILLIILAFLFPLIARYDNTIINGFKNAFLLSVSNLGSCIKIIVAWIFPLYLTTIPGIFMYVWFLWLVFGFGLIAYGTSFTMRKVFKRIDKAQNKEETDNNEKIEKIDKTVE